MPSRIKLSAVLIAVGVTLLTGPSAMAGTYDVYSCRLPDGAPAPTDGWSSWLSHPEVPWMVQNDCPAGDGLLLRFIGMDGRAIYDFGWGFDAPLHTLIDSIEIQRRYVAPYTNSENFPQLSGYYATSGGWPPQPLGEDAIESCLTASVPLCAVGAETWSAKSAPNDPLRRADLSARSLRFGLKCWASLCRGAGAGELRIHSALITLRESDSPVVEDSVQFGEIGSGSDHAVKIAAVDKGSGIRSIDLMIDERIASRLAAGDLLGSCVTPYAHLVPCPLDYRGTLAFTTRDLQDGHHRVWVRTTDAAGNVGSTQATMFYTRSGTLVEPGVASADQAPPAAAHRGPTGPARLRAWFEGRARQTSRIVPYGRSTRAEGIITDAAGNPLAGVDVRVRARMIGSVDADPIAIVRSDGAGRFTVKVPPGPTRRLEFTSDAPSARSDAVTIRVRARVTLTTSSKRVRNGSRLQFRGHVMGERAGGRLVTIYALSKGPRKRIPVETVRTRSDGRFSYTYEFTSIPGPVTYRFEARMPQQAGFPYLMGASKSVAVRGRE